MPEIKKLKIKKRGSGGPSVADFELHGTFNGANCVEIRIRKWFATGAANPRKISFDIDFAKLLSKLEELCPGDGLEVNSRSYTLVADPADMETTIEVTTQPPPPPKVDKPSPAQG